MNHIDGKCPIIVDNHYNLIFYLFQAEGRLAPITVTLRKPCKAHAIAETFCNCSHHRGEWSSDELKPTGDNHSGQEGRTG